LITKSLSTKQSSVVEAAAAPARGAHLSPIKDEHHIPYAVQNGHGQIPDLARAHSPGHEARRNIVLEAAREVALKAVRRRKVPHEIGLEPAREVARSPKPPEEPTPLPDDAVAPIPGHGVKQTDAPADRQLAQGQDHARQSADCPHPQKKTWVIKLAPPPSLADK
ncbi:hypothetical protein GQ43DRAFT_460971, partial [Delitschia confertaspora ATCC 74209]